MRICHKKILGFTLAELILALAIVSILTTAMVPMLKYHKVRQREKFTPHGIYECFYDDNGTIHSFIKDNDKNLEGSYDKNVSDGACVFPVPKATYYELHVIEPGSPGSGTADDIKTEMFNETKLVAPDGGAQKKSYVSVENFAALVQSLPSFIQDLWKEYDKTRTTYSSVKISSHIDRTSYIVTTPTYRRMLINGVPTNVQTGTKDYRYGAGNKGNDVTVTVAVHPNSVVSYTNPDNIDGSNIPILQVDGAALVSGDATKSAYGGYICGNHLNGSNCGNHIQLICKTTNSCTASSLRNVGADAAVINGSINNVNPKNGITFTYYEYDFDYTYGLSGDSGRLAKTFYNKLDAKTLEFKPAVDYKQKTVVNKTKADKSSTIYSTGTKIIPSSKKEKEIGEFYKSPLINNMYYEYLQTLTVKNISKENLPVPKELDDVKSRLIPKSSNYVSAYCKAEGSNTNGLCRQVASESIKMYPGLAGYGGYPVVTQINMNDGVTMTDKNGTHQLRGNLPIDDTYEECLSGKEPVNHGNQKFCEATNSGSGAVILLW